MGMSLALSSVRLDPLYNNIANLFGGAKFVAPLTHSVIPTSAATGTTANFTRATEKRIPDHEGVLRTLIAGEMGFPGARRVRNLFTQTENFTHADWTKSNGSFSGNVFTASAGGGSFYQTKAVTVGTWLVWAKLSCASGTVAAGLFANGVPVAPNPTTSTITVTTTPTKFSLPITITSAGTINTGISPYNPIASGSSVTVHEIQLEDITGRTDQTTPSEYVSVGVESAPAYHGSMVDGVKCFPTDLDGTPLTTMTTPLIELAATNYALQSNAFTTAPWVNITGGLTLAQNVTGPNGQANYAWTLTDDDALNYEGLQQNLVAWSAGANGCYSVLVGKKTSSPSYPVLLMYYNRASNLYHYIIVNEVLGTVAIGGSTNPPAYGCVSFNDDFWLVWVSGVQAGATLTASLDLYPAGSVDGSTLSAAKTGSTVFSDLMFEWSNAPSSRIPTTTVAATRNADQLYYTGADIANIKTLAAIGFKRESGVSNIGVIAELHDGTANEDLYMYFGSATNLIFLGRDGGTTVLQSLSATAPTNTYVPGTLANYAVSTGALAADKRASDQGGSVTLGIANAGQGTATTLGYGQYNSGTFQMNGYPGSIYGWTRNLSQSELNAVTQ